MSVDFCFPLFALWTVLALWVIAYNVGRIATLIEKWSNKKP